MKKPLLLLLLLPTLVLAQKKTYTLEEFPFEVDSITGRIVFRGVVQVPGASADQLYLRAKSFFFTRFRDAKAVIQVDDKAGGVLLGKGLIYPGTINILTAGSYIETPIEVRVKEGRYRYEITNMNVVVDNFRVPFDSPEYNRDIKIKAITKKQYDRWAANMDVLIGLINDLGRAMATPSTKDDW